MLINMKKDIVILAILNPPKFEEIDNGFRATSWDTEIIYQCTVECIYQNSEDGE